MNVEPREFLTGLFQAAVEAAQPEHVMGPFLPAVPKGRTWVLGAGKASAAMAQVLEKKWCGSLEGMVVTRYGYAVPCTSIEIVEAAHPVPDEVGEDVACQLLRKAQGFTADDLVICLISGGGSSLLPLPGEGISLTEKQAINRALLASGATISEINCVRRHLSAIKGGRLAAACFPARVVNLLISDVPGDQFFDIASGPTVADPTTCAQALEIVRRYQIRLSSSARHLLETGRGETVKPGDARLQRVETRLVAAPQQSLEAASVVASQAGITPLILSDRIEGESREVGKVLASVALQVQAHNQPVPAPCVLLSGGETTVTLRGEGQGGPNVECLLSMALALDGARHVFALAADTDGMDGKAEKAGALITPDTLTRARIKNISARHYLSRNNAHRFFEALDDSLITGPTLTNVNDFRAILIS